jgi:hypothetical protein
VLALHLLTSTTAPDASDGGSGGNTVEADAANDAGLDAGLVFDAGDGIAPDAAVSGRKKTVKRKLASTAWSLAELRVKRMSSSAAYGIVNRTFSQKRRRRA